MNQPRVPVVDVFAGCGGLSEGFAAGGSTGWFDVCLALDADAAATQTHLLRAFFHGFNPGQAPDEYYAFVRDELTLDELFAKYPEEAATARERIRHWELGSDACPDAMLHEMIDNAVSGHPYWVLIGGPPCQAYSIAGRSRRAKADYDAVSDHRNFLYREYLKILVKHRPAVFVMENVPGMLNAKIEGRHVWNLMIEDLIDPSTALADEQDIDPRDRRFDGYRIFSLVVEDRGLDIFGVPQIAPEEFVVKCEDYGIPQCRHRVLLFGVRADIGIQPMCLTPFGRQVTAGDVIEGLPRLRSGVSRSDDTEDNWVRLVAGAVKEKWCRKFRGPPEVAKEIERTVVRLSRPKAGRGGKFVAVRDTKQPRFRGDWFFDPRLGGVCNHETKAHMESDLHRYLFAACYSRVCGDDLRLDHFPLELLPQHKNVITPEGNGTVFADRFAVQQMDRPSRTIVSHIAKDGHYYIHPDPSQCRSLTVREAARLQTFPDNFYFMGNRTDQYRQVGNAVPPLLAVQVAEIVRDVLERAAMAAKPKRASA